MITTPKADYHATHRFARISVRKVRPLLDLIRGLYADDALDTLKYMPHRGARLVEQVLKSAMANAEERGIRKAGDLVVVDARGDGGPMFKRLMPRARGMAYLIRRRSSHIAVGLSDPSTWDQPPPEAPAGQESKKEVVKKPTTAPRRGD
jgi:large subunit ribosomal protein L22